MKNNSFQIVGKEKYHYVKQCCLCRKEFEIAISFDITADDTVLCSPIICESCLTNALNFLREQKFSPCISPVS